MGRRKSIAHVVMGKKPSGGNFDVFFAETFYGYCHEAVMGVAYFANWTKL
jgi:hypothetical protein